MKAEDEVYVALKWDSGPYAFFYTIETPGHHDGTALVKRELWERYEAAEALVMRLQDEIEAARITK